MIQTFPLPVYDAHSMLYGRMTKVWKLPGCRSPIGTTNVARILLPVLPRSVKIAGEELFDESEWDEFSHTF